MCLVVLSSAHPEYPFVLISNRDEFLHRPTKRADWWDGADSYILGGRDQQRTEQGTWLGMTRRGRISVLTNFREEGSEYNTSKRSRGELPNSFLRSNPEEPLATFAKRMVEDQGVQGVGGFTLIFGQLHAGIENSKNSLGIISNRTPDVDGVIWLAGDEGTAYGQTCALSNSAYGDRAWPKVVKGEQLVNEALQRDRTEKKTQEALIEELFGILSTDTLPRKRADEDYSTYTKQLRHSIFIPPIGADADADSVEKRGKVYATHKQTVILVDKQGMVTFVERTLYDNDTMPVAREDQDRRFDFQIEGWGR